MSSPRRSKGRRNNEKMRETLYKRPHFRYNTGIRAMKKTGPQNRLQASRGQVEARQAARSRITLEPPVEGPARHPRYRMEKQGADTR